MIHWHFVAGNLCTDSSGASQSLFQSSRACFKRALNDLTLFLPSGYFETHQRFVYSVRSLLLTPPPTIPAINLLIGATCWGVGGGGRKEVRGESAKEEFCGVSHALRVENKGLG